MEDKVLDPVTFEKFLHDRIKVNGKAGKFDFSSFIFGLKVNVTLFILIIKVTLVPR